MKISNLFIITILFLLDTSLFSQECGTLLSLPPEASQKEISEYLLKANTDKSFTEDSIGITIHIVNSSTEFRPLSITQISSELSILNLRFSKAGQHFFMCGPMRTIKGLNRYDFDTGTQLNTQYHVANTLNIYYVNDLTSNALIPLCGYAIFPWEVNSASRYVMMNKSCATDGATLAHEIGHIFGLLHTHEQAIGKELVNGANCSSAGDLICDTPADPQLGYENISNCNYVGKERDPNGQAYKPNPRNIMSYAPSDCVNQFSQEQSDIIRFYYDTEFPNLINNCDFFPDILLSSSQSSFKIRSDEDIQLELNLETSDIEIKRDISLIVSLANNPNASAIVIHKEIIKINEGSSKISKLIEVDFPLNKNSGEYVLIAKIDGENDIPESNEQNNSTVFTVEVDNSELSDAIIFPNPVSSDLKIFLRQTTLNRNVLINIWTLDGKLMKSEESYKLNSEFFGIMDVSELKVGAYICELYFLKDKKSRSFLFFKTE